MLINLCWVHRKNFVKFLIICAPLIKAVEKNVIAPLLYLSAKIEKY